MPVPEEWAGDLADDFTADPLTDFIILDQLPRR